MKLDDLQRKLARPPDKVPPGWKTDEQWSKEWAVSRSHGRVLLNKAVAGKFCERRKFVVMVDRIRPVAHYKFKS